MTDFYWDEAKKKFSEKKNPKWPIFKMAVFQNRQFSKIFCENFMDFVFVGCFCPYVGQPHDHIGWATSMPFASINPTNPRTNPWNFHKKILRIGDFEKRPFWKSAILDFFFCLIPMKISHKLCDRMNGTQSWCFPLFPANSLLCVTIRYTV